MAWNNRLSPRLSGIARSSKLYTRIFTFLGALALLVLLSLAGIDLNRQDDTNEEEVDVSEIPPESIEEEHEIRDVPLRPIIYGALVLLAAAIVIHVGLWWILQVWTGDELTLEPQVPPAIVDLEESPGVDAEDLERPGPNLQAAPALEYQIYLAEELEALHAYGRVQGEPEFARIPIERAMQILAEQGLPARDGEVPDFGLDPAYELDSEGGQEFRVPLVKE